MRLAKYNNRRVIVGLSKAENEDSILIQFKRLIKPIEVESFLKSPPAKTNINRNIVNSGVLVSIQGAICLQKLLTDLLNEYYDTIRKTNSET